jgi:hypothetical protein
MIAGLLVFLLVLGIMPAGMLAPAYAIRPPYSPVHEWLVNHGQMPAEPADSGDPAEQEDVVDTDGLTPPVSTGNGLTSDETQAAQAAKLGLPTNQPSRLSPSGREIDKKKNPLGPDLVVTDRIYQLGYSRRGGQNVYPDPFKPGDKIELNAVKSNSSSTSRDFIYDRVVTATDKDGNGTQELVTAGIVIEGNKIALKLFAEDYNKTGAFGAAAVNGPYTINADLGSYPGTIGAINDRLKIAAGDFNHDGKEEIAVGLDRTLYICQLNTNCVLQTITMTNNIIDLKARDADGDGFLELLAVEQGKNTMVRDSFANYIFTPANLHIYKGFETTDLANSVTIPLTTTITEENGTVRTESEAFMNASVDVGDIFGDGMKRIVIAVNGRLTYTGFDPTTETYNMTLPATNIYRLTNKDVTKTDDSTDFNAHQSRADVTCVQLDVPSPGVPVSLVVGGYIFQYDAASGKFAQRRVKTWTEDSSGDPKPNDEDKAKGGITNVNERDGNDKTWIIDTIAGNFDGNKDGREQIIMLHYNNWYKKNIVYLTQCYVSGDQVNADLREVWRESNDDPYRYPAICAIDYKNTGLTLQFHPERSKFVFSNPVISAVLAVSPFYEELADISGGLEEAHTVYGTGTENSDSTTNGITANVGVTFGFEQGFSVLGVQIAQVKFEAEVTNSFGYEWENGKSIEKTTSFTNMYSDNAVVVTVVPQDLYYYTAYYKDEQGNVTSEEMVMQVPYAPIITMKTVTAYNLAAASIPGAPIIGPEVLGGVDETGKLRTEVVIGDPRTYPQTTNGLTNVTDEDDKDVIMAGKDEYASLVACGVGDSAGEQTLTSSSFSGKKFNYAINYNAAYSAAIFGVSVGISYGAEYSRSTSQTNSRFATRAGSVASVPTGYDQYEFQWALAVYKYDLTAGDSVQRCEVINYLVKPINDNFPPKMPANFTLDSQGPTGNAFKWDVAEGSSGYTITRFTSEDGTVPEKTYNITGKETLTYTDTEIDKNTTYYYMIQANGARNSRNLGPLKVDGLSVTGISIKTQPKLTYNEGDKLDLSALVVTLSTSNGTSYDIGFSDFGTDLTTNPANEFELTTAETGTPVTVQYLSDKTVDTENLTVNAKSPYDFTISVSFKVGTNNNATALEANKTLEAVTQLTNTASSAQDVLVILALYSDKGNMEKVDYIAKNIASAQTQTVTPTLTLPGNVSGYTAKVFVWDGTSFTTTTLSPKSPTIKFP